MGKYYVTVRIKVDANDEQEAESIVSAIAWKDEFVSVCIGDIEEV
jgi:hypothetical protein